MKLKRMKIIDALARIGRLGKCRIDHEYIIRHSPGHVYAWPISSYTTRQLYRLLKIAARRKWVAKE